MTPIKNHEGKLVVRTNAKKATPFLRSLEKDLKRIRTECERVGCRPQAIDLGCGSGRNSLYLESFGFYVKSLDQHPDYALAVEFDLSWQTIPVLHDFQSVILLQYVLMFFGVERRFEIAIEALRACPHQGMIVLELQEVKSGKMNQKQIDKFVEWFVAEAEVRGFSVVKRIKGKVAVAKA